MQRDQDHPGSLSCQILPKIAATAGANDFRASGAAVALDADPGARAGFAPALGSSQQQGSQLSTADMRACRCGQPLPRMRLPSQECLPDIGRPCLA